MYNHIVSPRDIENNSNLHFFKKGIHPMWEDPANQDGGKWVLTIKNDQDRLAKCWMEVVSKEWVWFMMASVWSGG